MSPLDDVGLGEVAEVPKGLRRLIQTSAFALGSTFCIATLWWISAAGLGPHSQALALPFVGFWGVFAGSLVLGFVLLVKRSPLGAVLLQAALLYAAGAIATAATAGLLQSVGLLP